MVQAELDLPETFRFFILAARCARCGEPISESTRSSLHTLTQAYLALNYAAIDLRVQLKLTSLRYALVLIMCEEFESFTAMTRVLFGKTNAANAEIKQMRKLVASGYISRNGRPGTKSSFRLTIKGRNAVDKVLRKHKIIK